MPILQRARSELARRHGSAAQSVQLRDSACMIVVHVGVENELDVLDPKPERLDARDNLRRRLRQIAVDEHMSLRRGDEFHRPPPAREPDCSLVATVAVWAGTIDHENGIRSVLLEPRLYELSVRDI